MLPQALCIISYPLVNSNWSYNPETPNLGQIRWLLELCDLEIWQMTLNKANLRDLIAATSLVILLKLDQNGGFFACVTLKFDWWPRKNNKARLLYYIKLCVSFQIDQWIQTGVTVWKRPIWVKFDDFLSPVTLQFDVWPWKKGHLFYATSSFVHHFVAISDFKLEIQSGNGQFGSKLTIFLAVWPWNLTYDLEKTIRHLFYATSSFVHHFVATGVFKLELQSGNVQFGSNSTIFRAVWPWNLTDDL